MSASRLRTWLASTALVLRLRLWRWLNPARQSWVPRALWWKLRPELHVYAHTTASFTQTNFRFRTISPASTAANAAFNASDPAINTNISANVTSGNFPFRLRIEIDESAGGSENVTWNLAVSRNGGGYTALTSLTAFVDVVDSTSFADDDATTNLISGSARAFLAGYADDSGGVMPNAGNQAWAGNQHTELDVCLEVIAADVSDGDTLDFRIYKSGGTAINAYTRTPRITVIKTAPKTGTGAGSFAVTGGSATGVAEPTGTGAAAITVTGGDATGEVPVAFPAPTGLTATPISTTAIDVAWDSVATATGYDLEREEWDGGAWIGTTLVVDNTAALFYDDTGLTPDTLYRYRVRAKR